MGNHNYLIEHCKTIEEVDKLFSFMSVNLDFEIKNKQYVESRRREIYDQFKKDKEYLLFIKDGESVICGLTMKHKDDSEITLGMLATDTNHRRMGIASKLLRLAESLCKKNGYARIALGARASSAGFYMDNKYKPMLMIQLFGGDKLEKVFAINDEFYKFDMINLIKKERTIFYNIDIPHMSIIEKFMGKLLESEAQFVFIKDLTKSS